MKETVVEFLSGLLTGLLTPTLSAGSALAGQFALSRWNRKAQIRKEWGDRLLSSYEAYILAVDAILETLEGHWESEQPLEPLDLKRDLQADLGRLRTGGALLELYDRSKSRSQKRKDVRTAVEAFITTEINPSLWAQRERALLQARDDLSDDLANEFGK